MIVEKALQFGKHFGYVWSFSMFGSSLCTLCCKDCNLVQTLVETQLVQSRKKAIAS